MGWGAAPGLGQNHQTKACVRECFLHYPLGLSSVAARHGWA